MAYYNNIHGVSEASDNEKTTTYMHETICKILSKSRCFI